eukprot:contig_13439_g3218
MNGRYTTASLPEPGARETRDTVKRVPVDELPRLRHAIYAQYESRTLPTFYSTLECLSNAGETPPAADDTKQSQSENGDGSDGSDDHASVSGRGRERAGGGGDGAPGGGAGTGYKWSRAALHRALQDISFSFSKGPNHYDVAREKTSVRAQRNNFIDSIRKYRELGRRVYYTDETWVSKNITVYRSWNDGSKRARLIVSSGRGARIIVAHVGSRSTGLPHDEGLVFIGKKMSGDYHGEMNSATWRKWLEDKVLPLIRGDVLVVDRAPYHLVRTQDTRPARANIRKAEFVAW